MSLRAPGTVEVEDVAEYAIKEEGGDGVAQEHLSLVAFAAEDIAVDAKGELVVLVYEGA